MKKLKQVLDELGVPSDIDAVGKFEEFMNLVLEKNEYINLTTIIDRDEFELKHLVDSVICYGWREIENAVNIIDIGTGAGFPGVPLAILYPNKSFLLVDSLNKRLEFIKEATKKLDINNVEVFHGRAEDVGRNPKYRESFDLCVSRACANLSTLSEYCLPLVKLNGYFYAYKTKRSENEIEESELARKLLGGSNEVEIRDGKISQFGLDHNVWVTKKIRNTPNTYPRKVGTPSKVPL
jgi:16S rRNA (guanine527-N7)-methyltransferase